MASVVAADRFDGEQTTVTRARDDLAQTRDNLNIGTAWRLEDEGAVDDSDADARRDAVFEEPSRRGAERVDERTHYFERDADA